MFPTYDLGVSTAETVGARRERKARQVRERRGSASTTSTSTTGPRKTTEYTRSSKHNSDAVSIAPSTAAPSIVSSKKSKFSFFGRRNKDVQEIVQMPAPPKENETMVTGPKSAPAEQTVTIKEITEPISPADYIPPPPMTAPMQVAPWRDQVLPSPRTLASGFRPLTVTGDFPSPISAISDASDYKDSRHVESSNATPTNPIQTARTQEMPRLNTGFRLQDKSSFRLQAGRSPTTDHPPMVSPSLDKFRFHSPVSPVSPLTNTSSEFLAPPPARGLPPLPPHGRSLNRGRSHDALRPSTAGAHMAPFVHEIQPMHLLPRSTSIYSQASAAVSERTIVSNSSGFTAPPRYDEVVDPDSDSDGRDQFTIRQSSLSHRTPSPLNPPKQPLPLPPRSASRQTIKSDHSYWKKSEIKTNAVKTPFGRVIARMESAGPRIIATRLSEEWDGLDDDDSYQEIAFEKRLWALTAYQFLTQGKQLQSPAHEMLLNSLPGDNRKVLNIHGSIADGYILATLYPHTIVYTTTSHPTPYTPPASQWPAPLNHHTLYIPSITSALPFPTSSFDAVISRSLATLLPHQDWAHTFHEATRVLKPGARMEVLSVDPGLMRMGEATREWTDQTLVPRLDSEDLSRVPSDSVLDAMDIGGLKNVKRARIALPAAMPEGSRSMRQRRGTDASVNPTMEKLNARRDSPEVNQLMVGLGRHFYSDLYGKFIQDGPGSDSGSESDAQPVDLFWHEPILTAECVKLGTKIVLTISCGEKPLNNISPIDFDEARFSQP